MKGRSQSRMSRITFRDGRHIREVEVLSDTPPWDEIKAGDKVMLNMASIHRGKDYDRLSARYRDFLDAHFSDVFTVKDADGADAKRSIVCLEEDDAGWLFWKGDLIKIS